MRQTFSRMVAILLLVIPGFLATWGFLKMKDAIFDYMASHGSELGDPAFDWPRFVAGLLMFAGGVAFLGGWIRYRDRRRRYVGPRFRNRTKERE